MTPDRDGKKEGGASQDVVVSRDAIPGSDGSNQTAGVLLVLASAAAGAFYFLVGAHLVKPGTGVSVRSFTLVLYVWASGFCMAGVLVSKRGALARVAMKQVAFNVGIGLVFAASVVLAFASVQFLAPASAAFMFRTNVLFTLAFGFFFLGERLAGAEWFAAFSVVTGVGCLFGVAESADPRGLMMALGSALCAAIYQLLAKRSLGSVPAFVVNAYRNVGACVAFLIYSLVFGLGWPPMTAKIHACIVLAAFIGPFLHSQLYLEALSRLDLMKAALLQQTQPVFVLGFSYLISVFIPRLSYRSPTALELLGDILILIGVLLLVRSRAGKKKTKAP